MRQPQPVDFGRDDPNRYTPRRSGRARANRNVDVESGRQDEENEEEQESERVGRQGQQDDQNDSGDDIEENGESVVRYRGRLLERRGQYEGV